INAGTIKLDRTVVPVAHWTFDGNTQDSSGNGHDGTITASGTSFVTGQFGQALQFTGSQSVAVPFSSALALNTFTISAWVNMASSFQSFTNGIMGSRIGGDGTFDVKVQSNNIHGDIGNGSSFFNTGVDINPGDTGSNGQGGNLSAGAW